MRQIPAASRARAAPVRPRSRCRGLLHRVGARSGRIEQRPPVRRPKAHWRRVMAKSAPARWSLARASPTAAQWTARGRRIHIAVEERDDGGGPVGQPSERLAATVAHRLRAGEAARRQMFDQIEEERQIVGGDALLVEGQDEKAVGRCGAGNWSSRPPRRCPCRRAGRRGRIARGSCCSSSSVTSV